MRAAQFFVGKALLAIGVLHFLVPRQFEAIVPEWVPAHRAMVYASGVTEIATSIGWRFESTRRAAGWLGIATMVGVYPANVDMALHPDRYADIPAAALYARLPLQFLFVWWIYRACLSPEAQAARKG
jgi:uncharacterized membrane protein